MLRSAVLRITENSSSSSSSSDSIDEEMNLFLPQARIKIININGLVSKMKGKKKKNNKKPNRGRAGGGNSNQNGQQAHHSNEVHAEQSVPVVETQEATSSIQHFAISAQVIDSQPGSSKGNAQERKRQISKNEQSTIGNSQTVQPGNSKKQEVSRNRQCSTSNVQNNIGQGCSKKNVQEKKPEPSRNQQSKASNTGIQPGPSRSAVLEMVEQILKSKQSQASSSETGNQPRIPKNNVQQNKPDALPVKGRSQPSASGTQNVNQPGCSKKNFQNNKQDVSKSQPLSTRNVQKNITQPSSSNRNRSAQERNNSTPVVCLGPLVAQTQKPKGRQDNNTLKNKQENINPGISNARTQKSGNQRKGEENGNLTREKAKSNNIEQHLIADQERFILHDDLSTIFTRADCIKIAEMFEDIIVCRSDTNPVPMITEIKLAAGAQMCKLVCNKETAQWLDSYNFPLYEGNPLRIIGHDFFQYSAKIKAFIPGKAREKYVIKEIIRKQNMIYGLKVHQWLITGYKETPKGNVIAFIICKEDLEIMKQRNNRVHYGARIIFFKICCIYANIGDNHNNSLKKKVMF